MRKYLFRRYEIQGRRLTQPISATIDRYVHGDGLAWHHHYFGQLAFAKSGVVRVLTPTRAWIIPPTRAVWLPPFVEHGVVAVGETELGGIYIDSDKLPWTWREPTLIALSPLMRELAITLAEGDPHHEPDSAAGLAGALLLKVLPSASAVSYQGSLPVPRDERLAKICEHLMSNPASENSLDFWGEKFGAHSRTLARHFKEETGMTFRAWRQHMRVMEGISRLAQGQSVARVSADLGYSSASTFISMFRQITGESPQRYLLSK